VLDFVVLLPYSRGIALGLAIRPKSLQVLSLAAEKVSMGTTVNYIRYGKVS